MKSFSVLAAATIYAAGSADAFQSVPSTGHATIAASRSATALYEYIPSGFTKASWAKFQAKEQKQKQAKVSASISYNSD